MALRGVWWLSGGFWWLSKQVLTIHAYDFYHRAAKEGRGFGDHRGSKGKVFLVQLSKDE